MPRLRRYQIATLFAIVLLVLTACEQGQSAPQSPSGPPPAMAVTALTLKTEPITLTRELPGRVLPFLMAEVRPQVTGIINEELVNEGGMVEAGQTLYSIDDAGYRAEYNRDRAALARAEATLEVARLTAKRSAKLVETGTVSNQEHENTMAVLHQAEAEVGVAEAEVASSKVVLDYTRITAPISGWVGKSLVTRGALVTANQSSPLVTVQQLDTVYVDVSQSADELLELRRQLDAGKLTSMDIPVEILLDNGVRYTHDGNLLFSEVTVDPSTGSYLLRIEVPNPQNILLPGMYVRAVISHGRREDAVLVPQQGISRDPKGNAGAMVVSDGKVEYRPVMVNRTVGDQWLVDSGLVAGDQVIIEGLQKIQPGMPVLVTEAASAE